MAIPTYGVPTWPKEGRGAFGLMAKTLTFGPYGQMREGHPLRERRPPLRPCDGQKHPFAGHHKTKKRGAAPYGQRSAWPKAWGKGALAMRWAKEEGSAFAGHRMAKKSDPTTWPKGRGCGNFFSALTPTTILEWGELIFEPFR